MLNTPDLEQRLRDILASAPATLNPDELRAFVSRMFEKGARLLNQLGDTRPPLWVLEREVLRDRAQRFREAFENVLPQTGFFYAMKSNNHPEVSRTLAAAGFGIDVSSGLELQAALGANAAEIVFSGPGKTDDELAQAARHPARVTVLIDSFTELARLGAIADTAGAPIRAGVRITPPPPNRWRKFGIPLDRLAEFFDTALAMPRIALSGIQFHSSWNLDPSAQSAVIAALGKTIADWPSERRAAIRFLDIGGGFWPEPGEWLLSVATERGKLMQALDADSGNETAPPVACPTRPIEEFARDLAQAIRTHIFPHAKPRVCFEPGRYLCNDAMQLLLTVIDKKAPDLVVTDAGANAIGWERFESDYCPVLNLTRPALIEHPCEIVGSLCTPHDYWGFSYWGEGVEPGDILMIPNQGAYTWSLRQEFIKPLPQVVVI